MVNALAEHLLGIPHHAVSRKQYKKGSVYINGGNAGLHKAQAVQRKQHSPQQGIARAAGKPPCQQIKQRHHGRAEHGPHHAPAKGGHAEQHNAQHDQILAQRRVCGFIHRQPVRHFIGGARVVDLVKIHTVPAADMAGHQALLVKQGAVCVRNGQWAAVCIAQRKLHHAPGRNRNAVAPAVFGQRQREPAERNAVIQTLAGQKHTAVGIENFHHAVIGDAGIHPHLSGGRLRLHGDALRAVQNLQRGLRGLGAAQVPQAHGQHSQRKQAEAHSFRHGPARLRQGQRRRGAFAVLHRVRLCAQGERGGSPRQKNKESGFRKAAQPCGQRGQRAGHEFIVGTGIAVYLYQIDKAGQAQARGRAQQPPVAPFGSGQQCKGKAGQQIALVHTVAEGEHAHGVKCPQQQRAEGVFFQPGQREQRQCGGEQAKQQNAPLLPAEGAKAAGLRHPVSAKALGQIKGVDHGIGIAGAGGGVFFPKPGQHPAAPERQPGQHHHGGAQGGAGGGGKHGAKPLPGPGAHKGGRKRGGQHRPGQKSLRLNGQCKPIQGSGRHKAIFA